MDSGYANTILYQRRKNQKYLHWSEKNQQTTDQGGNLKGGILLSFIVIDCEAITDNRNINEILELGACKVEIDDKNGHLYISDTFHSMIKPTFHKKIPKRITNLTHISMDDCKHAPNFENVLLDFSEWAGKDSFFIAWGNMDRFWIKQNCRARSLPHEWISYNYIDYQRVYQKMLKRKKKDDLISLHSAAEQLGIPFDIEKAHRALADAYYCAEIFRKTYRKELVLS